MIWHKLNHANPEFTRYHQLFEYVFILSKGKPRCFNPIMDKPNAQAGKIGALGQNTYMKRDGAKSTRHTYMTKKLGMRGNVWRGKTAGQEVVCKKLWHPAMMPLWLAKDLIRSWSNEGDTILDPFAGSCTSLLAAKSLGRRAIGIEISAEYCRMAVDRRLFGQMTMDSNECPRSVELATKGKG
jgi:site-specific DNA-methyltransferase (adenine-specific)